MQCSPGAPQVPAAAGMRVHLNLWMFRGRASCAQDAVRVTLSGFTFTPLPAGRD